MEQSSSCAGTAPGVAQEEKTRAFTIFAIIEHIHDKDSHGEMLRRFKKTILQSELKTQDYASGLFGDTSKGTLLQILQDSPYSGMFLGMALWKNDYVTFPDGKKSPNMNPNFISGRNYLTALAGEVLNREPANALEGIPIFGSTATLLSAGPNKFWRAICDQSGIPVGGTKLRLEDAAVAVIVTKGDEKDVVDYTAALAKWQADVVAAGNATYYRIVKATTIAEVFKTEEERPAKKQRFSV